jgi:membrane dipeptidase
MEDVSGRALGGEFDWPRAVEGGLDAPFFSIFTPASMEAAGTSKRVADELIDIVENLAQRNPDKFEIPHSAADVRRIFESGRIALLLGMENGSPIAGKLENLDHFHARGVRYITLCHGEDNHICDSSYDTHHTHGGLTPFGAAMVRRMNELGILVDISHVSDESFWDVMAITQAPAIASHSSLRHFVPGFERNMSDEMVRRLSRNGGVVMINFGSTFLTADANMHGEERRRAVENFGRERGLSSGDPLDLSELRTFGRRWDKKHPFPFANVGDVVDHIDRVVELAGIDHVGFGSDFDGVGDTLPRGLKDVSDYPNLIGEMRRRGYSREDIEKVCSGNLLRVMARSEDIARRLSGRQ